MIQTNSVGEAIAKKDFARAMELRDPEFNKAFEAFVGSTFIASANTTLPLNVKVF